MLALTAVFSLPVLSISTDMLGKQTSVFLVVVLAALILSGCFTIVRDRAYTFREPVQVDTAALRIDGYYYLTTGGGDSERGISLRPLVLWSDGTSAMGFVSRKKSKLEQTLETYLEENVSWGAYRVHGDTIRMQYLAVAIGGIDLNTFRVLRYEGRIRGDTLITLHSVEVTSGPNEGTAPIREVYNFEPLPPGAKPDSSNWLHERYRTDSEDRGLR